MAKLARIGTRRDRACPGVDPEQDCVRVLPAGPDRLAKKWPPKLARAAERLRLALRYANRLEYAVELARCHLRLGQLQQADDVLTHVFNTEPSNEKGLYYATVTKIRLGDFTAAQRLNEQGRLVPPSPLQGWWQRLQSLTAAAKGTSPERSPWLGPS